MEKKILILCMCFIILLGLVGVGLTVTAKDVEFRIQIENTSVEKEDEVTILLTVESSAKMKSMEAYLTYDSNVLEFVKSEDDKIKGASGRLHLKDEFYNGEINKTYRFTMKALEVGKAELIVDESYMEKTNNFQILKTKSQPAVINVEENSDLSSDARLDELLVFPECLDQEFKSGIYEYSAAVESDITELIISAIPKDENSIVTVHGNSDFKQGENLVTITVTAESGEEAIYTIKVIK